MQEFAKALDDEELRQINDFKHMCSNKVKGCSLKQKALKDAVRMAPLAGLPPREESPQRSMSAHSLSSYERNKYSSKYPKSSASTTSSMSSRESGQHSSIVDLKAFRKQVAKDVVSELEATTESIASNLGNEVFSRLRKKFHRKPLKKWADDGDVDSDIASDDYDYGGNVDGNDELSE
jgi:hypothetical protein